MATFVRRIHLRCPRPAVLATAFATSLLSLPVRAQEAAPPPPPAPVEAAPAPAPAPPPAPPVTITPSTTTAAPAAVVAETAPPANQHKKMDPPAIWFRLNNVAQNPKEQKKLNGFSLGSEVDILFSGQVHEYVGWQADFVATFGNQNDKTLIAGSADILDLIGKFDFADPLHVWVGRMLVPSDRSNFSGPWFMSPWNYPGSYLAGPPVGPRQGPFGRNDGATLWGQFFGGYAKYYLGAFDLHDPNANALVSGRLNFTLLNPEPGYYHSSTYYGGKDIVALGLGGQYKKKGSVEIEPIPAGGMPNPLFIPMSENYTELNADLLAEKKFGDAGVGTLEGAYYTFGGKYEPIKSHFYVLGSYLLPQVVGIGRFQPLVRYQQADPRAAGQSNWRLIDAAVSYVVDEYAMRIALNYTNANIGGVTSNAIQLGIQIQK
jgi:hypothetical protein